MSRTAMLNDCSHSSFKERISKNFCLFFVLQKELVNKEGSNPILLLCSKSCSEIACCLQFLWLQWHVEMTMIAALLLKCPWIYWACLMYIVSTVISLHGLTSQLSWKYAFNFSLWFLSSSWVYNEWPDIWVAKWWSSSSCWRIDPAPVYFERRKGAWLLHKAL